MNYNLVGRLAFEPQRSLAFGGISAVYAKVGTPFANPIKILVLQNQTNVAVTFSLDGINDTITLASNSSIILEVAANRTTKNSFFIGQGTQVWVNGTAATSGSVFISAFYGTGPSA